MPGQEGQEDLNWGRGAEEAPRWGQEPVGRMLPSAVGAEGMQRHLGPNRPKLPEGLSQEAQKPLGLACYFLLGYASLVFSW